MGTAARGSNPMCTCLPAGVLVNPRLWPPAEDQGLCLHMDKVLCLPPLEGEAGVSHLCDGTPAVLLASGADGSSPQKPGRLILF